MTGERKISHWNYRVFCQPVFDGKGYVEQFTIREAFYDDGDSRPHSWSDPAHPFGESKLALMEGVTAMASAISLPMLVLSADGDAIGAEEVRRGSFRR